MDLCFEKLKLIDLFHIVVLPVSKKDHKNVNYLLPLSDDGLKHHSRYPHIPFLVLDLPTLFHTFQHIR